MSPLGTELSAPSSGTTVARIRIPRRAVGRRAKGIPQQEHCAMIRSDAARAGQPMSTNDLLATLLLAAVFVTPALVGLWLWLAGAVPHD